MVGERFFKSKKLYNNILKIFINEEIEITNQVYIHYLTQINMDLAKREE